MRPRIRANCWLCIVTSLALAMNGVTSPIRTSQTPNSHAYNNFLSRNFALALDGCRLALTPATPGRASVDADNSEFDEEEEYESSWSLPHLVCPTFIPSGSPPNLLSRPCPGSSPPRTVAVPLRC